MGDLVFMHPHWLGYPCGVEVLLGDSKMCDQEGGRFNVWNQSTSHSLMASQERLLCSTLAFFPHVLYVEDWFFTVSIYLSRDFHCSSHVLRTSGRKLVRVTMLQYSSSSRNVLQSEHIPSCLSEHAILRFRLAVTS